MQKWILWLLLGACIFNNANAEDCTAYEDKIRKLEDLRRHGGSLKQMERWRMQTDELTSKKFRCGRGNPIQIVSGHSSNSTPKASKTRSKSSTTATTAIFHESSYQNSTVPASAELPILRSLKDCIKPNNLIDNDVQECRQGLREPSWKH